MRSATAPASWRPLGAFTARSSRRAPLDATATAAGVGNATLYRHFPDRATLRAAVLGERLREVAGFLGAIPAEEDPWSALECYVRFLATIPDNTLVEVLVTPPEDTPTSRPSASASGRPWKRCSGGRRRPGC